MNEHSQIITLNLKAFLTVILIWHDCSSAIIHSNQASKTNNAASVEKNVLTTTRSLVEEIFSGETELQREGNGSLLKIKTICQGDAHLSARLIHLRRGREESGGWRNVKVSQDHMTSKS